MAAPAARAAVPDERYDGWRGDGREIANRLVQLIDWADEGGGAYYRDLQTNLVRLACTAPAGPPRIVRASCSRASTRPRSLALWAGTRASAQEVERFTRRADRRLPPALPLVLRRHRRPARRRLGVRGHRLRLPAAQRAASTPRRRRKLARFLVEDFKQYVVERKPQRPAGAADRRRVLRDRRRRAHGPAWSRSCAPTAPPSSSPRRLSRAWAATEAAARILNAAHTILLHAVPDPEPIVKVAGTRLAIETSLQHERGRSTDLGSARQQHQLQGRPQRGPPPARRHVLRRSATGRARSSRSPLQVQERDRPTRVHAGRGRRRRGALAEGDLPRDRQWRAAGVEGLRGKSAPDPRGRGARLARCECRTARGAAVLRSFPHSGSAPARTAPRRGHGGARRPRDGGLR